MTGPGGVKSAGGFYSVGDLDEFLDWKLSQSGNGATDLAACYRAVPWLFRGIWLRANSIAGLPLIISRNGDEIANSQDWENRPDDLAFLEDPPAFLSMVESSLTLLGACYYGLLRNRLGRVTGGITELRYYLASSIKPDIEAEGTPGQPARGLIGFKRDLGKGAPIPLALEDVLYFWFPDPLIEIGPPKAWPAQAALSAAGVLLNLDNFASAFFSHGAVKATLLTVPKNTAEPERNRLKAWWNRVFKSSDGNAAWQTEVVEADAIKPVVIGEGIKELENSTLTPEKRQGIAAGLDIPETLLFSGSASGIGGGGVSEADDLRFANQFILPEARRLTAVLNKQMFGPMGLSCRLGTESLKVLQEDEAARSQSLSTFLDAVNKAKSKEQLTEALKTLGYDLTDEQINNLWAEKQPVPATLAPFAGNKPAPTPPGTETPPGSSEPNNPAPEPGAAGENGGAKALEREQFKRWARKRAKAGKGLDGFEFVALDAGEQAAVIAEAQAGDNVAAPFPVATLQGYRDALATVQARTVSPG